MRLRSWRSRTPRSSGATPNAMASRPIAQTTATTPLGAGPPGKCQGHRGDPAERRQPLTALLPEEGSRVAAWQQHQKLTTK
jgi:hypothetical protein